MNDYDDLPALGMGVGGIIVEDYDPEDYADLEREFEDPYSRSALRASSRSNPRNLPCPTCHRPNRLTPRDVALHYQCDSCADRAEAGFDY